VRVRTGGPAGASEISACNDRRSNAGPPRPFYRPNFECAHVRRGCRLSWRASGCWKARRTRRSDL